MKADRILRRYARERYRGIIQNIIELADKGSLSYTTTCRCEKVLNRLRKDGFKVEIRDFDTKISW